MLRESNQSGKLLPLNWEKETVWHWCCRF